MSNLILFACPYDITAQGFSFSSVEEFERKYKLNGTVEEYEIEFIDGTNFEMKAFAAMKVHQGIESLSKFFDVADELESDEMRQAAFCYLLENLCAKNADDALSQIDDVMISQCTLSEYAEQYISDCFDLKSIPQIFVDRFDYDGFARDLSYSGDVLEYVFGGVDYVIVVN